VELVEVRRTELEMIKGKNDERAGGKGGERLSKRLYLG
jgi:hypothetical protein